MNPDPLVVALLATLFLVLGLIVAAFIVYRSYLRRIRRANRGFDPLAAMTTARFQPVPFQPPSRWVAIRSGNTAIVAEALVRGAVRGTPWSEALARSRERSVFISPPVDGWTLLMGGGIPDPSQDVDRLYHFLRRLSEAAGEVYFFSADRVLSFHSWVRMDDGKATRAYVWAGETLWNEGRPSLEELELGLKSLAYGEDPEPVRYGEAPAEFHNMERVLLLARRWSIDLIAASEILLHQEAVESGGDDEPAE